MKDLDPEAVAAIAEIEADNRLTTPTERSRARVVTRHYAPKLAALRAERDEMAEVLRRVDRVGEMLTHAIESAVIELTVAGDAGEAVRKLTATRDAARREAGNDE